MHYRHGRKELPAACQLEKTPRGETYAESEEWGGGLSTTSALPNPKPPPPPPRPPNDKQTPAEAPDAWGKPFHFESDSNSDDGAIPRAKIPKQHHPLRGALPPPLPLHRGLRKASAMSGGGEEENQAPG